jgi:murein DD-endopeptidase MepM/ murein hydrolase activator NlpD
VTQPKPYFHITWLSLVLLVFTTFNSLAASSINEVEKDTVLAQVVYGDQYLFVGIDTMSLNQLTAYHDSLKLLSPAPEELISQLHIFLKIRTMKFDEIYETIDSLFELEEVPFALINELNKYISDHQNDNRYFAQEIIDTSQYPADYYYHNWNTITPNPYNATKLSASDSVINLKLIGTSQSPAFFMPVTDVLTSKFGWRDGRMHKGIDMDLQVWDTVVTAFSGMVRVARTYSGYGRVVVVRHFNGLETLYAHLHRIKVKPGQIVEAGELVGLGGSSGQSTGSHLHWEVRFKGVPINPLNFIDYKSQTLIDEILVLHKTKNGFAGYPKGSVFYNVQNGDYLYKIAKQYGTTVTKICKLNGINRNSNLRVGQKIRVI